MNRSTKTNGKPCIALVRGPIVFADGAVNNEATPAIAFAYISGYLHNKGYETVIIDSVGEGLNRIWRFEKRPGFNCQGLSFDEIITRIPKNTNVVGFSGMFSGEWPALRELITMVRKQFPKVLLVAGGEHITALSEYVLNDCPALDVCVRGEGEHTFFELLEAYFGTGNFSSVVGIGYLDCDGYYHQNDTQSHMGLVPRIGNIDEILWPYWPEGYLERFWAARKSYGVASERDMPFIFSRGCPYRCTFCSNQQMWTTRYILRDIDDVIAEVKAYIARYNITAVQLYDMTAIIKRKWIVEFLKRLIEENINLKWSFPSGTRSEILDKEILGLLVKSGCKYLVYAPESGSPNTLVKIRKHINLDLLTKSVLEAKRQGLTCRINLIIGFPHETWRDILKTVAYGLKMATRGVDEVPLFVFSPYPGTEIFEDLMQAGKIVLNDDYFFSLTSLNGEYLSPKKVVSYNPNISPRMLGVVRTIFILMNYSIGYILYPHRILRTVRNCFSDRESSTVFEHRMKDLLNRKRFLNE